jgi:hypothetical protein
LFIYIVSRDPLGKFDPSKNNIWQQIDQGGQMVRSTPAYYDATNLATQLYNSTQAANGRDSFGQANLFNSPTVVAGKVFVPTRTGIAVFGLR